MKGTKKLTSDGGLMELLKRVIQNAVRRAGYDITRTATTNEEPRLPPDFDDATKQIYRLVRPFTMTSPERVFALRQSVQYVIQNQIQGDIVECGVWKGGSMMVVAWTLRDSGIVTRNLHLFDTFEGMPAPTQNDVSFDGKSAADLMSESPKESSLVWALGPLEEVRRNLLSTGYPIDRISFIKERVEESIPKHAPAQIALLRLDTDWYESTHHELLHLYPRLSLGGVLIIDDYGHWAGAKKAVDEYFAEHGLHPLFHRIDYTGRIFVKTSI
jgi:O-methyltransferase